MAPEITLVAPTDGPAGQATLDDVTLSNAGLIDGSTVVVAPGGVEPARVVRLDRVLEVAEHGIRREGAVLSRDRFERVADELRSRYGWS